MVRMTALRRTGFFVSMAMIALGCSSGASEESTESSTSESADSIGDSIGIVRSYMPSTGEHFYTASYQEAVNAGFHIEAYPYYYLGAQSNGSLVPFYRCYIPSIGKHFDTTSSACEGAPANNEGSLGFISRTPCDGAVPLHRLYAPSNGDHFYTIDGNEAGYAQTIGYHYEGVAGYVFTAPRYRHRR
jgi:hypothetical protein